jgi:DNA-directed RNA polymerase specialized sigma24 family protein
MSGQISCSELITRAQTGDQLALEWLLVQNSSRLSRYINARMPDILRGIVDSDDIEQRTYMRAIRGIGRFHETPDASFWRWLRTIADNQIRSAVEAQRAKKRGGRRLG